MQSGLISILIPFKNTELFLKDCLDSILKQTYTHWEAILIDDASTDSSLEIVSQYKKKDTRIKVFANNGQGIIPALQTAYKNCNGQFITRMDSDDIMLPQRLKKMMDSLVLSGEGHLAVGQVKYFSDRGISNGYERYEAWLNRLTSSGTNYKEIYKECVVPSPCWMVFRSDFEQCGGFNSNRYPEDYDLTFRFYQNGLKIIPCDEVLHLWRDYDSRTSRTSEHYAQNYFLDIKLHYFLKLDYNPDRPLMIWGAGFKGKSIAKGLLEKDVDFVWLCDNPNKIGKKIYDQPLHHFSRISSISEPQSIITVANEDEQKKIISFFDQLGHVMSKDYFFFC
ncbi:glycosyltransferase family 2 protein [Flagellimonas sp. S174]|uniref:glycosyltransferase family 2 protein n=1 Tax=Flagellimonas sp. S174 TaxID=3410790 RepID=UPI003BF54BD7